jgi:hypothetical protein
MMHHGELPDTQVMLERHRTDDLSMLLVESSIRDAKLSDEWEESTMSSLEASQKNQKMARQAVALIKKARTERQLTIVRELLQTSPPEAIDDLLRRSFDLAKQLEELREYASKEIVPLVHSDHEDELF